jgi:hypothetical protein
MNTINMPGFTAEASLYNGGEYYETRTRISNNQQIIPQVSARCIHKANRYYDRCRLVGYGNATCAQFAVDFADFCEANGL